MGFFSQVGGRIGVNIAKAIIIKRKSPFSGRLFCLEKYCIALC